ncbi:MAG: hypothetical protein U5K81_06230 [Trueperaceae bacterium]|nr:hypothetical protein [Trueperaceae bacterium]
MEHHGVTFIECNGPGAHAHLAALRRRLRERGVPARLLRSREEASLHLLLIEGDIAADEDTLRDCRRWRFEDAPAANGEARG